MGYGYRNAGQSAPTTTDGSVQTTPAPGPFAGGLGRNVLLTALVGGFFWFAITSQQQASRESSAKLAAARRGLM